MFGQLLQMVAQNESSKANARIMRNNAAAAMIRANAVRFRGRAEERYSRYRTKQTIGTTKAAIASNGFAIDSGSSLDRIGDIAAFGELDALTIRYNTELDAQGLEMQASQCKAMASYERQKGKFAMLSGMTSIFGSAMSESSNNSILNGQTVHSRWYQMSK
ncbi:MAG: hypothetical protein LC541_04530 [Candidatus Thiodiazotropha sp.]|nr:hypothetical protein [Candidatus Thiodiazotropha sp.]MCM8882583.1 hypothetical protein [Candidatus Thiodiazotropha sp.]MCM8918774.1 hypothetical protein [Candidatus Thiodiazotropha sp.]